MARLTRAWLAAGTATLVVGAGLGVASPADAEGVPCAGMSAPQNVQPGNGAPTPQPDTATALAGGSQTIRVLRNDTDPDRDGLYVVSVGTPDRGDVCIDSDGAIEYFAAASATSYTDHFTYGVTDGDLYRTATVTVSVTGIKPMRAQLMHRKRGGHKAVIRFLNPNTRNMVVLAGTPKKKKALLTRTVAPGHAVRFKTKYKKILFFALVSDNDGVPILVDIGSLNTHNGHQSIISGGQNFFRTGSSMRTLERRWSHR